jgi:hypothetical protein
MWNDAGGQFNNSEYQKLPAVRWPEENLYEE